MKFAQKIKISTNPANIIRKVAFFKNRIFCSVKNKIYVINEEYHKCGVLDSHKDYINDIITVDNDYIVTGSDDKYIGIWNSKAIQPAAFHNPITPPILIPTEMRINSILYYNNRLFVGGDECDIKVYSFPECQFVYSFDGGHTQSILYLEIVPYCDNQICSAGMDGKVIIWDTDSKSMIHSLNNHLSPISSIKFYDCNVVCVTCFDGENMLYYYGTTDSKTPDTSKPPSRQGDRGSSKLNSLWHLILHWNEKICHTTDSIQLKNSLFLLLSNNTYDVLLFYVVI